jgi:TolB-like protein
MFGWLSLRSRVASLESKVASIQRLYEKSLSYRNSDPEVALVTARITAEAICTELIRKAGIALPKTRTLKHLIETLGTANAVPKKIEAPLKTILEYGNYGGHYQHEDAGGVIAPKYADPCLDSLVTVVQWYFLEHLRPDTETVPSVPPPPRRHLTRKTITWLLGCVILTAAGGASVWLSFKAHPRTPGDSTVVEPTPPAPSVEPPRPTVAVLPFECLSADDPKSVALADRISSLVRSSLENAGRFDMVERSRLESVLTELELSKSTKFDQSQVARIGKLLGARRLVLGDYFHLGGSLRVNVRFVDTETGRILWAAGHDGPAHDVVKTATGAAAAVLEHIPEDS